MGEMFVKVRSDGEVKEFEGLTLAEQTRERVYLENENQDDSEMEEFSDASLVEVRDCEKIGFIDFNPEEVENIDGDYIAEPTTESAYLGGLGVGGSSVTMAEQRGGEVYVEFTNGYTVNVSGELDRAYTY